MTVHPDYEIKININELIEKRIPCCDLLHPDHCLTEQQVSEIAHGVSKDLNLHDIYKQVDQHIMNYATAAGVDNISLDRGKSSRLRQGYERRSGN